MCFFQMFSIKIPLLNYYMNLLQLRRKSKAVPSEIELNSVLPAS